MTSTPIQTNPLPPNDQPPSQPSTNSTCPFLKSLVNSLVLVSFQIAYNHTRTGELVTPAPITILKALGAMVYKDGPFPPVLPRDGKYSYVELTTTTNSNNSQTIIVTEDFIWAMRLFLIKHDKDPILGKQAPMDGWSTIQKETHQKDVEKATQIMAENADVFIGKLNGLIELSKARAAKAKAPKPRPKLTPAAWTLD